MSVSPSLVTTPRLSKGKQILRPQGFQLFPSNLIVLPLFSRHSRPLHDPQTITHSCINDAFHKHVRNRNICPRPKRVPKRIPKAKTSTRGQSDARILSASPKTTLCLKPEPYAQILNAYPKTNERAPGELSKRQRKYQESMASSIISNRITCPPNRLPAMPNTDLFLGVRKSQSGGQTTILCSYPHSDRLPITNKLI